LASEFGVSRERVRQIEVRAFEKVQEAVVSRMHQIEARRLCRRTKGMIPKSGNRFSEKIMPL